MPHNQSLRRPPIKKVKNLSTSDLKTRGWTTRLIEIYAPPHIHKLKKTYLYDREAIERIEQTSAYKASKTKSRIRSVGKHAENQIEREAVIAQAHAMPLHVPQMPYETLVESALSSCQDKDKATESVCVAYLLHIAEYDRDRVRRLTAQLGGVNRVEVIINDRLLDMISVEYPEVEGSINAYRDAPCLKKNIPGLNKRGPGNPIGGKPKKREVAVQTGTAYMVETLDSVGVVVGQKQKPKIKPRIKLKVRKKRSDDHAWLSQIFILEKGELKRKRKNGMLKQVSQWGSTPAQKRTIVRGIKYRISDVVAILEGEVDRFPVRRKGQRS